MAERPAETCENCLREDSDIVPVRRIYLVPEAWDRPASSTTLDETERWCITCRSTYPHEQAG